MVIPMYDELIKNLRGMAKGFCPFDRGNKMCGYFVTQQAADAIEKLQKRKHGKWIMKEVITGEFGRLIVCQCSKCKKNQTFQTMYCSKCGAEMEFDKGWYGRCMTN